MWIAGGQLVPGERLPAPRALAEDLGVNTMTVRKAYQQLRQEGYVSSDRRTGVVELTEKGRSAAAAWQHACGEMEQQLLQGFTPEEAERFAQYLRRARENLRAVQSHRQKEDVP